MDGACIFLCVFDAVWHFERLATASGSCVAARRMEVHIRIRFLCGKHGPRVDGRRMEVLIAVGLAVLHGAWRLAFLYALCMGGTNVAWLGSAWSATAQQAEVGS